MKMNEMEKISKQEYISPKTVLIKVITETTMITASPGVGGSYDPNKPIDAKETLFDDDTDYSPERSRYSLWDD